MIHGGFSDHRTNWEFVLPLLSREFGVHAVARRGRGETQVTEGHTVEDEGRDAAGWIRAAGEPVFLLGHSYGAHVALVAASIVPELVRGLVLYEPPWPRILNGGVPDPMAALAAKGDWDGFSFWFFRHILEVPADDLNALRDTELWPPIVTDAPASFGDLQALARYNFEASRFAGLALPVLLQAGSESPRHLWATDALAEVLPNVTIDVLPGQAHEAMTTAPELYARSVTGFLRCRMAA